MQVIQRTISTTINGLIILDANCDNLINFYSMWNIRLNKYSLNISLIGRVNYSHQPITSNRM